MNNDRFINNLCKFTGASRKQVIATLKKMSGIESVQKELEKFKRK